MLSGHWLVNHLMWNTALNYGTYYSVHTVATNFICILTTLLYLWVSFVCSCIEGQTAARCKVAMGSYIHNTRWTYYTNIIYTTPSPWERPWLACIHNMDNLKLVEMWSTVQICIHQLNARNLGKLPSWQWKPEQQIYTS